MDLDGNRLAHPFPGPTAPQFMKIIDYKDTTGKLFVQEYIKVAKTKGEGWTEVYVPDARGIEKAHPDGG